MAITMIAAMDRNRVIGVAGEMPWRLPDDLKRFRRLTEGGTVVMGRKTFESIGRPLPGRRNVVVTRRGEFGADGVQVVSSLNDALQDGVFVIGGGEVYTQALPQADRMELTLVDVDLPRGDAYFPAWDTAEWREVMREHHPADARHAYAFAYVTLERA
jgi:dihydrofolate reductase